MPNQYIIDYFKKNKDRFSFDVLKEKLIKAGYPSNQIEEAAQLIYKVAPSPKKISGAPNFWDFWHKKVYTSGKEKILDFATGFIFAIILEFLMGGGILGFYGFGGSLILYFIVFLAIVIFLSTKRKYIAFGIICGFISSIIFIIVALFGFLPFYF
jgi:tetrahydromethanopterin S-methyltransferase subunit F